MGCFTGFLAEGGIQGLSFEEEGCVRLWLRLLARIVSLGIERRNGISWARVRRDWEVLALLLSEQTNGSVQAGLSGFAVVYRGSVTI